MLVETGTFILIMLQWDGVMWIFIPPNQAVPQKNVPLGMALSGSFVYGEVSVNVK
jgi:hypothetical protein